MLRGREARKALLAVAACGALLLALAGPAQAGSLKRVNYRANENEPGKQNKLFFDHGGLQMRGSCTPGGGLDVVLRNKHDGSMIHANSQEPVSDAEAFEDDDWGNLAPDDDIDFFNAGAGTFREDSDSGQIVYSRPDGKVVSLDWASEVEGDAYGGLKDCVFIGTARVLDSSSGDRVNYRANANDPTKIFTRGGMKLTASCNPSGDLNVAVESNFDDAVAHTNTQASDGSSSASNLDDLDTGESGAIVTSGFHDNKVGQVIYARPSGPNVALDYAVEDSNSGDEAFGKDCVFVGTIRVRSSGDPKRVNARLEAGDTTRQAFAGGGLRLNADCPGVPGTLGVLPKTKVDHGFLHGNTQSGPDGADYGEDDDFLLSENSANRDLFDDILGNDADDEAGQLIFSKPDGTHVTIDFLSEELGDPLGGTKACVFLGTAEISKP